MPILPQYQRVSEDDLPTYQSPLLKKGVGEGSDDEETTYPPRAGPSGVSAPGEFIFVPRYPIKGPSESVLGVMGKNKAESETIALVQEAFPRLAVYPPERIEFLITTGTNTVANREQGWSRILDKAWDRMPHHPPQRLKIQIADGPGDAQRRKRRVYRIFGSVFMAYLVFILFLVVMANLFPDEKHKKHD